MRVVQMIIEVCLRLLSQTLPQRGIIYKPSHGLSKGLDITRRHQQTVLLLDHILALTTIIGDNHRMPL